MCVTDVIARGSRALHGLRLPNDRRRLQGTRERGAAAKGRIAVAQSTRSVAREVRVDGVIISSRTTLSSPFTEQGEAAASPVCTPSALRRCALTSAVTCSCDSLTCQACSYHPARALVAWTTPLSACRALVTQYNITPPHKNRHLNEEEPTIRGSRVERQIGVSRVPDDGFPTRAAVG